jgi:outer membrane protein TolC
MPACAPAKELPSENLSLEEQIQRRAYELYVQRGNQSGSELNDWLQAEEEILQSQEQALAANR